MTEREFLIQLAVNTFNAQYGKHIEAINCDIKSITPNLFSTLAYEVYTVRMDDFVRLRMYLEFNNYDDLGRYRLEVDGSSGVGILGDEVYVASGYVDSYYRDSGLYKFGWLDVDIATWGILLAEDDVVLITEDIGDYLILETSS